MKTRMTKTIENMARYHAKQWMTEVVEPLSQLLYAGDRNRMKIELDNIILLLAKSMMAFYKHASAHQKEAQEVVDQLKVTLPMPDYSVRDVSDESPKQPGARGDKTPQILSYEWPRMNFYIQLQGAAAYIFREEFAARVPKSITTAVAEAFQDIVDQVVREAEELTGERDQEYWDRRNLEVS